jgi:hypothetical protein
VPANNSGFLDGADFIAALAVEAFFAAFRTFAHRAFWAVAILARASALKVRFFLLCACNPTAGAFFAVDAAGVLRAAFFAAFLDFAQRALWAAAILSRAAALNVRLVLDLPAELALAGRPGFNISVVLMPTNSALTCCSLEISASISTTMFCIFMNPPGLRITHRLKSSACLG